MTKGKEVVEELGERTRIGGEVGKEGSLSGLGGA